MKNVWRDRVLLFVFFLFLSVIYTHPGEKTLFEGSTTQFLSDGTDPTAAAYQYELLKDVFSNEPSLVFYGGVASRELSAPEGMVMWFSVVERLIYLPFSSIVPSEQITSLIVVMLYLITSLSFYMMARAMGWPRWLAIAGAIAWSVCCFTRARAKVHSPLNSLYFLPLVFWSLLKIKERSSGWKWKATLGIFLASTAPHYFLIMLGVLSPFCIWYLFVNSETKLKNLVYAVVCSLPAILFLAWSLTHPAPKDYLANANLYPRTGETQEEFHPFLFQFAAKPIDYFTGEFAVGSADLNPLRSFLSESVKNNIGNSNYHERSNGIRWSIWATVFFLIYLMIKHGWKNEIKDLKPLAIMLLSFAAGALWLSLSPSVFGWNIGPSGWVHKLISQFRVPSRASVFVHFALLLLAGEVIRRKLNPKHLWVLPLIVIAELPPFLNDLPISPIQPKYQSLQYKNAEKCGTGMYFPYASNQWAVLEYYYFLQRLRGSRCPSINGNTITDKETPLLQNFALHQDIMKYITQNDLGYKNHFTNFVKCVDLSWIAFDPRVPTEWRTDVCQRLGWQMSEVDVCKSPAPKVMSAPFKLSCLGVK